MLLQTALQHGVMPLLYRSLGAVGPPAVPPAFLGRLRHHFYANALRSRALTEELLTLLELLAAHGIPALPYKGPVLAATVYGDVALRQSGDLDLVVPKRDLLRAKELLIARGYWPWVAMTGAQERVHLQTRYFYNLVHPTTGVVIDLHWTFTQRYWAFPLDLGRLWRDLEQVPLAGTLVPSLRPEDVLLVLCAHGAKHYWARLGWICDIAELLRVYQELDWGGLLVEARRLGAMRMLLLGLCLPQTLLGAALPEDIVRRLEADPEVRALAAQVRVWLWRAAEKPRSTVEDHLFYLRMRERWQDRVPYMLYFLPLYLRQAVTPNVHDRALLPLPPPFSVLSYVVRPVRLAGTYGWRAVKQRWQGDPGAAQK